MRLFGWVKWSEKFNRWVRRFRRASIWVPKKNGKSPTLAWWGLYLLCADGEQGQKVYFAAKDGSQAREIAGKHAVEMVRSSPKLDRACKINMTTSQITHISTKSILKPISGGDARTQKSKEGLNGSVLIDETHVVDKHFVSRISRAGISRSEPMFIELSTAGNDPESYGKKQFDRGAQVERGEIVDEGLLYVSYAAPQDLSDEDLAADPLKYGRMANPAMGYTIDEHEFLEDYNNSALSVSDLADFKMYRLNVWQKSSNPWLRSSDWNKCGAEFTLETFAGRECVLGLDKSKTRDMTALVVMFRDGDTYHQVPFFWLPRATAERHKKDAPFLDWAKAGYLTLIDGEVIEDVWIIKKVAEIAKVVRVQELRYDQAFASDITLQIEMELGIERCAVSQSARDMTAPIEDYERLIIKGALKHPNNPVLTWQAGHCKVRSDPNGLRMLAKPPREDIKKIDAMIGGVLALSGAMTVVKPRGPLFVTV